MHSRIRGPIAVAAARCACDHGATGPTPMGQLSVAIGGLPLDVPASVTITGSGGYSRQLGSSRLLSDVPAGTYTIAASSVTTGNARYSATPATQTVVVGANPQVTARGITFPVRTPTLTGYVPR